MKPSRLKAATTNVMKELFSQTWTNLMAHKLRSFLSFKPSVRRRTFKRSNKPAKRWVHGTISIRMTSVPSPSMIRLKT
jgi:hypothetical protein